MVSGFFATKTCSGKVKVVSTFPPGHFLIVLPKLFPLSLDRLAPILSNETPLRRLALIPLEVRKFAFLLIGLRLIRECTRTAIRLASEPESGRRTHLRTHENVSAGSAT